MLRVAFKEWAAVCKALAKGQQSMILRKGGIAEEGGTFRPEHDRFWLYPSYFHEQAHTGLKPEALSLIDSAEAERPPDGALRLTHFAKVTGVRFIDQLEDALALDSQHVWSEETVRQRFNYRSPGLYVLDVQIFQVRSPVELPENLAYAGCKTWVILDRDVEEFPADPVAKIESR